MDDKFQFLSWVAFFVAVAAIFGQFASCAQKLNANGLELNKAELLTKEKIVSECLATDRSIPECKELMK